MALFYPSAVNVIFGEPECGKTWLALAAIAEAARADRRCSVLDLDHNGADAILGRLLALGVGADYLSNVDRFRLYEPEDRGDVLAAVAELVGWRPAVAVVDSIGELLPIFGANSNSPDEFTTANRATLVPLASSGACVVAIDHVPKADGAAAQTGTAAKRRATTGSSVFVHLSRQFVPGRGGECRLEVHKDRNGWVRRHCPPTSSGHARQMAGVFTLAASGESVSWNLTAPHMPSADDPGPSMARDGLAVDWLKRHDVAPEDSIQAAQRAFAEHRPEGFSRDYLRGIQRDRQAGLL